MSILAVGLGAALGAWLRWGLALWLNPVYPSLPFGTLAANLVGGYLVGLAIAYFAQHPGLPPEARLFVVTGFLGGLTTFSTFSAEVYTLLARTQYAVAFVSASLHLFGSVAMTMLGVMTFRLMRG